MDLHGGHDVTSMLRSTESVLGGGLGIQHEIGRDVGQGTDVLLTAVLVLTPNTRDAARRE